MSDRATDHERVILVHVYFHADNMAEDLNEFKELALSAGAYVAEVVTATRDKPDVKYFVGTGKAEELAQLVKAFNVDLVIFNHVLTPAQERNLERLLHCRVLDRTGLILDIFAQRARTFEGKLQVELALLTHLSTRLIRGWTHLERQRGGIGLRGGPGETQLEVDRRLIRHRIKAIHARLERVRSQREQSRRARRRATIPTIALVGYTNAGKSTLFNRLSGSDVYVANQLFATLDPTFRRIDTKETGPFIIADTVGFIRHLPHDLVMAFHATLQEVTEADLLLHMIDAHDEEREAHKTEVEAVLKLIQADQVPCIEVYNKIDLFNQQDIGQVTPRIDYDEWGKVKRVYMSAGTGLGIDKLLQAISKSLHQDRVMRELILLPKEGKLRALFYERQAVLTESIDEAGHFHLTIFMNPNELAAMLKMRI